MNQSNELIPEISTTTLLVPSGIDRLNRERNDFVANMRFIANYLGSDLIIGGAPDSERLFFRRHHKYSESVSAPDFPQDYILTTPFTVFCNSSKRNMANLLELNGRELVFDNILAEGGRYAFGNEYVFFGYDDSHLAPLLQNSFDEKVLQVPTPEALGFDINQSMVRTHIDQFIGGPLLLKTRGSIVPIHREYYERLVECNLQFPEDLTFLPIGGKYLDFYIFNYPRTPQGVFFVDPQLITALEDLHNIGIDDMQSDIVILPESMGMASDGAGLKCRLNFIY